MTNYASGTQEADAEQLSAAAGRTRKATGRKHVFQIG